MKKYLNIITALFLLLVTAAHAAFAQNNTNKELHYEVNRVYPPVSVTKDQLGAAQTLTDLNAKYKSSWVKEYVSVEVQTHQNGKLQKAISKSEDLSKEQKDLMRTADLGTNISVMVRYLPDNTLSQNEIQEMDFTFTVEPEKEAAYPGGQQKLVQYLQEQAISKIPAAGFLGYDMTAVKFTVDEDGQVTDPHVFWPGNKNKVEQLLLDAVCNMPQWEPAAYTNGRKVKQEFVLTVGSMENCAINLLNIRQD